MLSVLQHHDTEREKAVPQRNRRLRPEIADYVESGESDDKAGAYAIQGRAARFIVELRGSYSGVMGLPLYETAQLLEKMRGRNPH